MQKQFPIGELEWRKRQRLVLWTRSCTFCKVSHAIRRRRFKLTLSPQEVPVAPCTSSIAMEAASSTEELLARPVTCHRPIDPRSLSDFSPRFKKINASLQRRVFRKVQIFAPLPNCNSISSNFHLPPSSSICSRAAGRLRATRRRVRRNKRVLVQPCNCLCMYRALALCFKREAAFNHSAACLSSAARCYEALQVHYGEPFPPTNVLFHSSRRMHRSALRAGPMLLR